MQKVSLIFTTSGHWVSRLIRFFTRSPVSHVMIGHEYLRQPISLHADTRGIIIETREKSLKGREVYAEYRIIQGVHLQKSIELLGQDYDFKGLIGFAIHVIAKWLRWKIRNPFTSSKEMFCSEFVVRMNQCGCIPEFDGLDPELTSPGDLLRICEKGGSFEPVINTR